MSPLEKRDLADVDLSTAVDKREGDPETTPAEKGIVKTKAPTGFSTKWTALVTGIHRPILTALHAVTSKAASNPKRTIGAVALLSLLLFVVGLLTNFNVDVDDDAVWTPSGARPVQHSRWIGNESGFPADSRAFFMIFHSDGENVLGRDEVSRVFQAVDAVRSLEGYHTMCADSHYVNDVGTKTCEMSGITAFWNDTASIFDEQVQSDSDAIQALSAEYYPDNTPVAEKNIMGFPERESDGSLTSALSYSFKIEFPDTEKAEKFESKALDTILDLNDAWKETGATFRVEIVADRSFEDEFERAIINDIPLLPIVFVVMSIFTCVVFWKKDRVRSRSLMGFGAVMAVLFSILSGYGLLFLCGVSFTSMTQILPFVIFGVGLDDAFIISGSYDRTDPKKESEDRIHDTIEDIGISITLTTITSALAFGLGALSTIPTVYWLCYYALTTILFVYIYQLTCFIACIALDERRVLQNRRDCCTWITVVQADEEEQESQEEAIAPLDEPITERFMGWYAEHLLRPWVKVSVVFAFTALFCGCAYSTSLLSQQFKLTDVVPNDSYLVFFFDALDDYSSRSATSPFIYFRNVDQSDEIVQEQMEKYTNDLVTIDAIVDQPEFFWLRDFKVFLNVSEGSMAQLAFNDQIDAFLAHPVYGDLHRDNIVRDDAGTITASRCRVNMDNVNPDDVNLQIDALEDQRMVTKAQPINQVTDDFSFFTYDSVYDIWEFYSVSAKELTLTTIVGVVAVTGVAFILIPHWTAAVFVLPLICVLYVDLLGVMQMFGIQINPVSYIALVMSIGLLVDYIMHVLLRYYESSGNRKEKTVETLKTMGSSILIGGISTFLGILPLAFSSSEIFTTIFLTFLGLVILGCGHGLILVPVILSTIGPEDEIGKGPRKSLEHHVSTVSADAESDA